MPRIFTRTITTPAASRQARPGSRPVVSLVTDFGLRDPFAGIMRAVILGVAPDALVIDISHDVAKFRVRDGALLLWSAVPYLPVGAHVAIVDPGVGTERRPIALETARGDFLLGPDNGILLPAAARLGGITRAHVIISQQYRLPVVSASFHGRDLFAPAAAHLATGVPIDFLGPAVDPSRLIVGEWPEAEVYAGILRTHVIYQDTFGNVKLSGLGPQLRGALGQIAYGERVWLRVTDLSGVRDLEVAWVETFGNVPPGTPLLYEDSFGRLCLAINQGSAAAILGIADESEVIVTRVPLPAPGPGFPAGPGAPTMPPPWALPPTTAVPPPSAMPGPAPVDEPAPVEPPWEPVPPPEPEVATWEPAPAPVVEPMAPAEPEPEPEPEVATWEPAPAPVVEPMAPPEPETEVASWDPTPDPEPEPAPAPWDAAPPADDAPTPELVVDPGRDPDPAAEAAPDPVGWDPFADADADAPAAEPGTEPAPEVATSAWPEAELALPVDAAGEEAAVAEPAPEEERPRRRGRWRI